MANANINLELTVDASALRRAIFGPSAVLRRTLRVVRDNPRMTAARFAAVSWPSAWGKGGAAQRAVTTIAKARLAEAVKAGYAHVSFEHTRPATSPVFDISAHGRRALTDADRAVAFRAGMDRAVATVRKQFPQGGNV